MSKRGKKKKSSIFISGSEESICADILSFQFRAEKLARKNMMGFGKSDPFYVINCKQPSGDFHKVFTSEVVKSKLNPQWKPQAVPMRQINNGEMERELKIDVFDHESDGDHKYIGSMCLIRFVRSPRKVPNAVFHRFRHGDVRDASWEVISAFKTREQEISGRIQN